MIVDYVDGVMHIHWYPEDTFMQDHYNQVDLTLKLNGEIVIGRDNFPCNNLCSLIQDFKALSDLYLSQHTE
jgi:hypothetical protein